jgi:hypothetical protein
VSKATTTFLIVLGIALAVVTDVSAQTLPPPATPRFEKGDRVEALAVDIFDRIVYLPVTLNGIGPFTFVLDTGAGGVSAVDRSVADSLRLRATPMPGGGGAGEETVEIGRVDSVTVSLPDLSFGDRAVFTIPLHRMDPHWGKRKDGVIGGDLLSALLTRIDYENKRVDFEDVAAHEYKGSGERIPLTVLGGFLLTEAEVLLYGKEEPIKAVFLVDTGVRVSLFNAPYAKKHDLPAQSPKTVTGVTGFGIGGVSKGIIGRVRGIRLGSILIENPVVDFSIDEAGALADTSFSGIIGADILSRFNVVLDYSRSQMVLEKNRFFREPSEFEMSGIRFVMEGPDFEVLKVFSVFDGSPAAEAGIGAGDVITAIDGREAKRFNRETLRDYLERDGKEVRLTIQQNGKTHDVKIVLRRMV